MANRKITAAVVREVVEVLPHDNNTCVLVLHVDDGQEIGLIFDGDQAESAVSHLLAKLPAPAGTGLSIETDRDLKSPLQVDDVEVSRPDESLSAPYDIEFQAAGKSWVKMTMTHREAVRWMHRLQAHIAAQVKRQGH